MDVKQSPVPDGYKQTDVGVIPEDWEVVHIGSIASFSSGSGISVASLQGESSDNPVPVFGGNGVAGFTNRSILREPTVVVGRVGQKCGEIYLTFGPAWITDNALYPRVKHCKYDIHFFALALNSAGLNDVKNRNDLPLVTQTILHSVQIPWTRNVEEQTAIATALSDVDSLLDALDRLIAKKRDLKQAAMQQLLTGQKRLPGFGGEWEVKRIGTFTDCTAGGTPSTLVPSYWGGSIPWMNSGELNLKLVEDVDGRVTEKGLNNSSTKMIPRKCVLIGLAGQGKTRGTVAMNLTELCTNQSIAAIFPNSSFAPEYLYHNLDARYDELRELSSGDGGRGGLNLTIIKAIEVAFPPLSEQTAIAAILSDMDAELSALEQRRDKTRAIKQGMMQELLTGKTRLVPPNHSEGSAHG